ncbi:MAG: hypothetical protein LIP09_06595 [Bacteroidales bacterium]|nr:hypothetical protein [Bacteroidales bacterium]
MKRFTLALMLAIYIVVMHAESPRILQNAYARDHVMLNGTWQTIVDPIETGYYDYRMNETSNGFFKNYQPQSGYEHAEYDFCDLETLNVPGDWESCLWRPQRLLCQKERNPTGGLIHQLGR